MEGKNDVTHSEALLRVIDGKELNTLFRTLFDSEVITFDIKWLRGMHPEGYTGAHVDNVYMSRGTDQVLTCWTPLDDIPVEMGTLSMFSGSNTHPSFKRFQETYGNCDIEKVKLKGTGWFTEDPKQISDIYDQERSIEKRIFNPRTTTGIWQTTDFRAGDVMIFTLRTIHMSTVNQTKNKIRLSCDTRWQPKHLPGDPRFVGSNVTMDPAFGVHSKLEASNEQHVTMDQLKSTWGFPV